MPGDEELVAKLRKMAKCIYIAVEETVADDIADGLKKAADRIEALREDKARMDAALGRVKAITLREDMSAAAKVACIASISHTALQPPSGKEATDE